MARAFEAKPAVRDRVPLLIGLMGPSGSGKTFSALRLATGIQHKIGGDIYAIDTESRRMLHYADMFKFKHVQFEQPFGSLDYLDALRYCVGKGASVVIVDSMSHEHEGVGGYLATHEAELDRIAGTDWAKRERVKMLAWQKPAANRRALINGLLQLNCNFIFCFRAKEKTKPVKSNGKTEIVEMGFMPIAGEEFLFEQTVNCLLLPRSGGVPTWRSDQVGERMMMKLPTQFHAMFSEAKPLDEAIGQALCEWARGVSPLSPQQPGAGGPSASPGASPAPPLAPASDDAAEMSESERIARHDAALEAAARLGTAALREAWAGIPKDAQPALKAALDRRHKPNAAAADATPAA